MSKSYDRLTLLETFVRIVRAGSITGAALDLGVTQPTVSRQLSELEERTGCQLVHRTTHQLSLTAAGKVCLEQAVKLIDGWDALVDSLEEDKTNIKGAVSVIAPSILGQLQLAGDIAKLQQKHPDLKIQWRLSDENIDFLAQGCDVWVKVGPVFDENLIVRRVGIIKRLLVANPKLVTKRFKHPRDAQGLPTSVLTPFEKDTIPLRNNKKQFLFKPQNIALSTNHLFVSLRAVTEGVACAVMPEWLVHRELEENSLVEVVPGWCAPSLDISIAYLPGTHRPKRVSAVIDFLRDSIQKLPGIEIL